MITLTLISNDKGIDNWFFFFQNTNLLDISYFFYTLYVSIAYGKQYVLT
jgi:hypothetical protein